MPRKAKILTIKEFASLRAVGDSEISGRPAPVIPAEHGARLIALGYMIQFCGGLRMTTPGRKRIAAGAHDASATPVDGMNSGWIGVLRLAGRLRNPLGAGKSRW
jgi:hypothetical protein